MARGRQFAALFFGVVSVAQAQPALTEPAEFPSVRPGPQAVQSGVGCFHLASGTITPGDVDWVQISMPRASTQTIIDVDFPASVAGSALLASIVNGAAAFNISDGNGSRDAFCGLSATTIPVGNTKDSAASLGATARNVVMNIGITGAADTGFVGVHSETFNYDVWVYALTVPCTMDSDCDDGVVCTADACDVASGDCFNDVDDTVCDNGLFCDGEEYCDAVRGCRAGLGPDCDDGVACTFDDCDPASDACVSLPDDGFCDNETFCDGEEWCDPALDCQAGDPPACDDGVECTIDSCDSGADACAHGIDDAFCDDGLFCTGEESCDPELDCVSGSPPACDDGVECTVDSCDADADACAHAVDDSFCDDGLFCTGEEACDPVLDCVSGSPPVCDDGVGCTVDTCDSQSDDCLFTADDATCDNGVFCDGDEWCNSVAGCVAGSEPCPEQFCRESDDRCVDCLSDADCDDGDFCNGAEACDGEGLCLDGTPPCPPQLVCNPDAEQCEGGRFTLDIKPRKCPNPFETSGQGNVAMAITGAAGADVRKIKTGSLRLERVDGIGKAVHPNEGPHGPWFKFEDVATPLYREPCACPRAEGDGQVDLVVRFGVQAMTKGLRLDKVSSGSSVTLRISGKLKDGTKFEAIDCIVVHRPGKPQPF